MIPMSWSTSARNAVFNGSNAAAAVHFNSNVRLGWLRAQRVRRIRPFGYHRTWLTHHRKTTLPNVGARQHAGRLLYEERWSRSLPVQGFEIIVEVHSLS